MSSALGWLARQGRRKVVLVLLFGAAFLYVISGLRQTNSDSEESGKWTYLQDEARKSRVCEMYPDEGKIAVSIKTGATEALRKLPWILSTSLACVRDVMIFSDLDQKLDDLRIHDVLSDFTPEDMEANPDFDIYRKQKELSAQHRESEIEALSESMASKNEEHSPSWLLDKYKFLHMLEQAWKLQPGRDWYVFLEADTYVSWANLNRWLATLDPKQKLYLGNALKKSDSRPPRNFAHGGSGFVLSGAAMKAFAVDHEGAANRADRFVKNWWAGDMMLSDILYQEMGLQVTNAHPMLNRLDPKVMPFVQESWCQPAVTVHHMRSWEDFNEFYQKEKEQSFSPLLLRDVYSTVYPKGLPWSTKDDWDNLFEAEEYAMSLYTPGIDAGSSAFTNRHNDFESCGIACEQAPLCFQYLWRNITVLAPNRASSESFNECSLIRAIRLGQGRDFQGLNNFDEPSTFRSWHSGWLLSRIDKWVQEHRQCTS